jgi:hypothetical protein
MKLRVVETWHYFEETCLMAQIEMRYILMPISYLIIIHFTLGSSVQDYVSVAYRKYVPKKTTCKRTIRYIGRFVSIADNNRPAEVLTAI